MIGNGPQTPDDRADDLAGDLADDLGTDERVLLGQLGSALGEDPLPAGLLDRAAQLILLRDLETDLADQLEDLAGEPAGVRGPAAVDAGELWFAVADGSVTVEVRPGRPGADGSRSLEGMLHGDPVDAVELMRITGPVTTTVPDPSGRFTVAAAPSGPLSLRLHLGARVVRTGWFVL